MRLKRLEMLGFKSFMEKSSLDFDQPITVIVGPNGCGKSNVVDAIRWVMGEQSPKHLRGTHMEDVIFNGSEREAPLGMASVEIVFSAEQGGFPSPYTDFAEVAICRRLYRDGTSEYLINRHPMRLRDIADFFAGTGLGKAHYAIVEQGRIAQLITAKPEERRTFIEEAAGVSRFKARKESALRKMEICEGNLLRLNDIIQELEKQMRSLERQVGKARRYQKLSSDLKEKDLSLSSSRYRRIHDRLLELKREHEGSKSNAESLERELAAKEGDLASLALRHSEIERELADLQERDYALQNRINLSRSSLTYKRDEQKNRETAQHRLQSEIEVARARQSEAESRHVDWKSKEGALTSRAAELDSRLEAARLCLETSQAEELALLRTIESAKEKRFRLLSERESKEDRRHHLLAEKEKIAARAQSILEDLSALEVSRNALETQFSNEMKELDLLRALKQANDGRRADLKETITSSQRELAELSNTLVAAEKDIHRKRSRLESLATLEKNFEGYGEGVRFAMAEKKSSLGTLAQVLDIDPLYETALSAALAEKLQTVLCESALEGREILEALKRESKGRVAFLPLDWRGRPGYCPTTSTDIFSQSPGVQGALRQFVRVNSEFSESVDRLVGGTLLIDSLENALALFNANRDIELPLLVTLDGDLIDPSGLLIGGKGETTGASLLYTRREQKALALELSELEASFANREEEKNRLKTHLSAIEQELEILKEASQQNEVKLALLEKGLSSLKSERDRLSGALSKLTLEKNTQDGEEIRIYGDIELIENRKLEIERELGELDSHSVSGDSELPALKARIEEERNALAHLRAERSALDTEKSRFAEEGSRLLRELSDLNTLIEKSTREQKENEERMKTLETELAAIDTELTLDLEAHTEVKAALENSRTHCRDGENALREREIALHSLRKSGKEANEAVHTLSLSIQELNLLTTRLLDHCKESYRLELPLWVEETSPPLLSEEDESLVEAEIAEIREKLGNLGAVNLDAISEFEEITARTDFLTRERADLVESLDSLRKALTKIDQTTKKRLIEAYQGISALFEKEFPKTFGGGRATLSLTDEADILTSGIEVFAQPPGKKLQSINLLSGGEKALTALSLLFSIMKFRPAPFCILDEVDAPLDDQNVHRYNELIKGMTVTQFILITHAKTSMEIGHRLYGVTMPNAGVSKIVSVDLEEKEVPARLAA